MPTKKDDRRTVYSKRMIRESLYELMKEKPLNKISVTEICQKADVNRSTFYAYYTDIYDLHQQIIKEFFSLQKTVIKHIKTALSDKNSMEEITYTDFYEIVYNYLQTVSDNLALYKFVFNQNANNAIHASFGKVTFHTIKEVLNPLIEDDRSDELKQAFTFVAGGTTALIMTWVGKDCNTPIEDMSTNLAKYYFGTFKAHNLVK